jgi:triosephosphate isomerase
MAVTPSKQKYLFANWKMYLDFEESKQFAKQLLETYQTSLSSEISMVVFPSALAVASVGELCKDSQIKVGSQNICWVEKGAYTGEISAPMYKAVGCEYVLLGHSERRHIFKETNHEVRQKLEAALSAGLIPVVCVGETLQERQDGKTEEVVEVQLRAAFEDIVWPKECPLFIAYEPVWAVNTGEACDPGEAERMHGEITTWVKGLIPQVEPQMLYGGSVRAQNVKAYLSQDHIQGVLVGGASVTLASWSEIIEQTV